jgi:hypothetical protein
MVALPLPLQRQTRPPLLGTYPDTGLKAARLERDRLKDLVKQGIDPSQNRQEEKLIAKIVSENSFEAVARQWWKDWRSTHRAPRRVCIATPGG